MNSVGADRDKVEAGEGPVEPGCEAWKRAKIERGLAESRNRKVLIPVERVWRDFDLDSAAVRPVYDTSADRSRSK